MLHLIKRAIKPALCCFVGLLCGCSAGDKRVKFVVPDGYEGLFWIVVDQTRGQELREQDGVITIRIPPSGVVRVRDRSPLSDFRTESAITYSGQRLKCFPRESAENDETVLMALWSMTGGGLQYDTYIVSSKARAMQLEDQGDRIQVDAALRERLKAGNETKP